MGRGVNTGALSRGGGADGQGVWWQSLRVADG